MNTCSYLLSSASGIKSKYIRRVFNGLFSAIHLPPKLEFSSTFFTIAIPLSFRSLTAFFFGSTIKEFLIISLCLSFESLIHLASQQRYGCNR